MAGPYAHITLLYELLKHDRMKFIFSSAPLRKAVSEFFPYVALGTVSPDYPNLASKDPSAALWADAMHTGRTSSIINSCIRQIRTASGTARDKQFAWLLGYAAHVVTDMTIHPVVQAKVGIYSQNQLRHRICEMHQDSYIYRRMDLGEIGESDRFAMIIAQCSVIDETITLDPAIATLWEKVLHETYPENCSNNTPAPSTWHGEFMEIFLRPDSDGQNLFPLARKISAKVGAEYPAYKDLDSQYIHDLPHPAGKTAQLDYEEIFYHGICNVASIWSVIEKTTSDPSTVLTELDGWDLDTGRDEYGELVYW